MPDVIETLTKDTKSVPTTAAWLAALTAVTLLIENKFIEQKNVAWTGYAVFVPGTPFSGQYYRAFTSLCIMGPVCFATVALAAMAEEDYPGAAAAAPRREAAAAPRERPGPAPAPPRAERAAAGELKVGDAVTLVFPDTSANAPLSGQRGVVEALPGGEYPDRYVVFVAATADSDQRRLAVKREHLEFFARGL